ncbi:MAG: alkaline phosphatase [Ruminococcaceae bacterium]|nr:alkaline phosphatase [Oscillospiraceae bacterium]
MENSIYKRAIVIGVDGAGAYFRNADTPNIDKIFKSGAVTYDALTAEPTISAECWGAMLLGVKPEIHRLTNTVVSVRPYPTDSIFPSIFRVIRENDPDASLGSFTCWNPINVGIVEDNLGVHKDHGGDIELTDKICDYIAQNDPKFIFVQFDSVDSAGHNYGYGTEGHLNQISTIDECIGKIYAMYESRGFIDDTLFIVTADHGGKGTSHGGLSKEELYVMFASVGKTVEHGTIVDMEIRDTPAIIAHAFGYSQPETWTSRVPSGLFKGVTAKERPVFEPTYSVASFRHREPSETPDHSVIADIVGKDRILAYLPLDGSEENAIGPAVVEKSDGKFYYVKGYNGDGIKLDDGYLTLSGIDIGKKSITICCWLKTGGVYKDCAIFANKDNSNKRNPGFVMILQPKVVRCNIGTYDIISSKVVLPVDYQDGWMHLMHIIDLEKQEQKFAFDFGEFIAEELPDSVKEGGFEGCGRICIGEDASATMSSLSGTLDEFLLIEGVLSDEQIKALAKHYGVENVEN